MLTVSWHAASTSRIMNLQWYKIISMFYIITTKACLETVAAVTIITQNTKRSDQYVRPWQ